MNAVTYNTSDERALAMKDFFDLALKLRDVKPLKAFEMSKETLLTIAPISKEPVSLLFGIPVELNNSMPLFEVKPIYA